MDEAFLGVQPPPPQYLQFRQKTAQLDVSTFCFGFTEAKLATCPSILPPEWNQGH